ncbi:MAG: phosphoribosylformimino-5-aminoimidazole carboxamide ribotide isomerase [Desulfobacteraceae bacterium]|nr:phosphoribosylformimino-5-aminoimidazole carboxamide ribotide isomerase [Desulfobacteraceae bacterium]
MRFRPCIDLHKGKVKQIVGGSLNDDDTNTVQTNFETTRPARWYAKLYRRDQLLGGHVIQLGPGNKQAAQDALAAWPGGLQLGGAVTEDNAVSWIDAGASAVIVTSWVFHDGVIDLARLKRLCNKIGKNRLVLDLSSRRREDDYYIVTNRWQTFTREKITSALLDNLAGYCSQYLVHAVDVEGKCAGVELDLVKRLARWQEGLPITYAGGIHCMEDIHLIEELGKGRLDFTVGSALDIFGGTGLKYKNLVKTYFGNK